MSCRSCRYKFIDNPKVFALWTVNQLTLTTNHSKFTILTPFQSASVSHQLTNCKISAAVLLISLTYAIGKILLDLSSISCTPLKTQTLFKQNALLYTHYVNKFFLILNNQICFSDFVYSHHPCLSLCVYA